jgi:hypothetical protein
MTTVSAAAPGEYRGDIRYIIQNYVMQYDRDGIPGSDDVLLDIVGSHSMGQGFGLQCVFRQVAARSPVGDDNRTPVHR